MAGKRPLRIPAAGPFETRPGSSTFTDPFLTDSFLVNAYYETAPDGRKFCVQRAGSTSAATYGAGATNGQGTTFYQGLLWAMGNNVLYSISAAGSNGASGTAWTASTAAPWAGRFQPGVCVFQGQIFLCGGFSSGFNYFNDVWSSYDGVNWTQIVSAAPWASRGGMGLFVLGNLMYLIGGVASANFADVWSTPDGVNWTQVVGQAAWGGRGGAMYGAFNQGLIVAGGNSTATGGLVNDVWYSPDGATWTQLIANAGWSARAGATLLTFQNKLWVMGGIAAGSTVKQDAWSSPDGISWTNTGNMPAVRSGMAACVYANKMWLLGGSNASTIQTTVWNTTDGNSFTVATSAYGGTAVTGAILIPYPVPASVSTNRYASIFLISGLYTGGVYTNNIYIATLNVSVAASYTPSGTGALSTEQWQNTTQNTGQYMIWKNTADAWVYWGGVFQKITSTNYPKSTVFGLVNLDDTLYVMDVNGVIYGSNLSDPFTWSALNFITADYQADAGVAIVKYQNYVLALKSSSMQIFYDAGRYPGSPLLPVIQYNARIGCASALSIQSFNNTVIWLARTEELGPYFVALINGVPQKISTPDVDNVLEAWIPSATLDFSFSWRNSGHYFYGFSLGNLAIPLTLVYDFTEQQWHIERTGTSSTYQIINYVTDGVLDYFQAPKLSILYEMSGGFYQDNGATITAIGQTSMIDAGNNQRKFTGSLTAIGDRAAPNGSPNSLLIQWSNDDGQTFSTGYTVDLTTPRPRVPRCGSFFRRRYRWTHATNNPMRLEALEQEIVVSASDPAQ